jgi:(1->4)-alpha-D-glucan 1-alpha-D-glucosylmutase
VNRCLVATYRLQLDPTFDLDAARRLAGHLAALGVSHVYLSPIFAARPGSTHGYDVVDPTRIRDELGDRSALDALAAALHDRGLGIVADIVPNHLAADEHDPWWWSVLRDGPESPHAAVFDVDWPAGGGRILLPVLGTPLADALATGELSVDTGGNEPVVRYFDRCFPLRPDVDPNGALPGLLAAQH